MTGNFEVPEVYDFGSADTDNATEICGFPMPRKQEPCARKQGHAGDHMSVSAVERERERSRKRLATETVCGARDCEKIAPVGWVVCPECARSPEAKAKKRLRWQYYSISGALYITPSRLYR